MILKVLGHSDFMAPLRQLIFDFSNGRCGAVLNSISNEAEFFHLEGFLVMILLKNNSDDSVNLYH